MAPLRNDLRLCISAHRIFGTATLHAPVLRRQLTFSDATTGFPAKLCPRNECRNSILMMRQYPGLGSASDWLKISSTNQKHYPDRGSDASSICNCCPCFSDVISRETRGGVTKYRLFPQATLLQPSLIVWINGETMNTGHASLMST